MVNPDAGSHALHRLYGLTLMSPAPIGPPAAAGAAIDWTIDWSEPPADLTVAPPGRAIVTEGVWPAVRDGDLVTLWHEELGRVMIDLQSRRIALALTIRTDEVATLVLRGVVLSLVLELTGVPTLHANGVIVGNRVVAVAGSRGIGKTTVTAALCAAGIALMSDDVLAVVRSDDGGWAARSGLTQLRLRPDAAHLAELIGERHPQRSSVDGRHVVVLPAPASEVLALGAIVVPRIDREGGGAPRLVPITGPEAFAHLATAFRVVTFVDAEMLVARLGVTAALTREVPVLALSMPVKAQWTAADADELRHVFDTCFGGGEP
ncbi:MAG: hypothetical protein ABIR68_14025 [Ilumatobacteraceae bacterium]